MDSTQGTLEDVFAKLGTEVVDTAPPVVPPVADPPVTEPVTPPALNTPEVPEVPEVPETPNPDEESDFTKNLFNELGYSGSIAKIETKDDIIALVKEIQQGFQTKLSAYEEGEAKGIVEFLASGGTIEQYKELPKPTNEYTNFTIADDNVAGAEKFLTQYLVDSRVPAAGIPAVITELKASGKLMEATNEAIANRKEAEEQRNAEVEAYNQSIIDQNRAAIEAEWAEQEQFIKDVTATYDSTMNGVTVDKALITETKKRSIPNDKGEVEIITAINKFTPQQHALLNLAAAAIEQSKSFSFIPTKANVTKANPIDKILSKGNGADGGKANGTGQTLTEKELTAMLRETTN